MSDPTDPNPIVLPAETVATPAEAPAPDPVPVFYTEAEQTAMVTPADPPPVVVVPPAPASPSVDEQLALAKLQLGLADVLAKVAEEMHDLFTPSTRASVKTAIAAYRSVRKAG